MNITRGKMLVSFSTAPNISKYLPLTANSIHIVHKKGNAPRDSCKGPAITNPR